MNRRSFITTSLILSGASALSAKVYSKSKHRMKVYFLRHATLIVEAEGVRILVDPMLSNQGAMDPVKVSRNTQRIPLVGLPISEIEFKKELESIDAVMVTHTHRDHWDEKARESIKKKLPLICQPTDVDTLKSQNFENLLPVNSFIEFNGLKIYRTDGQHGTGEIGQRMGHVSGFVIEYKKQKLYIAGDTIWCNEVEQALITHQPNYIIVNAGAARFDQGDPITMTAEDVAKVCRALPSAKVIAVHMETVNHCESKRADLMEKLIEQKLTKQCLIPADGERISL
jgi:L-ascorbate metabolism protein UlaG (beta-lactamase superfamily)